MALLDFMTGRRAATPNTTATPQAAIKPLPQTHEEWTLKMEVQEAWYDQARYTADESATGNLFRAEREDGTLIIETKRLTRDIQFVVDADRKLLFKGLTIEVVPTGNDAADAAYLEAAVAVWTRSQGVEQSAEWGLLLCKRGTMYLAPVLHPVGMGEKKAFIVGYDPVHVRTVFSPTGLPIMDKASIKLMWRDALELAPDGELSSNPIQHTSVRLMGPRTVELEVLDAEGELEVRDVAFPMWITTFINGVVEDEQSGDPGIGPHVPLVQLKFQPSGQPEWGLWACHGMEPALASIDSLWTMIQAGGARYGNPTLFLFGARLDEEGIDSAQRFGRMFHGMDSEARAEYLEASMSGAVLLLSAVQDQRKAIRETLPEFLFLDSGANSSGKALSFRASELVSKIEEIRDRIYPCIARALEMAVSMDTGVEYTPDTRRLKITAGPVLPVDTAALIESLAKVDSMSAIQRVDVVRHLQRVGLVPIEADPVEYAEALATPAQVD